jgi:purine-nucleoside phosphorylase
MIRREISFNDSENRHMELLDQINEASSFIRTKVASAPDVGIILGTGLGRLGERIDVQEVVPFDKIPHFPLSTVESHAGKLLLGQLNGKRVVAMQGRFHFYEGYTMRQVGFPVWVMKHLGTKTLVVCNASGGVNPQFRIGDIVIITDQINLQGANPLLGENNEDLGPRFPDMCELYDRTLIELSEQTAIELGFRTQRGVYAAVTGPCLETAAEYRMLRILGADVVGMSTVPEVIVARHQGLKVLGVSIVTDMGLPDNMKPVKIGDIVEAANGAEPKMTEIIAKVIERMIV